MMIFPTLVVDFQIKEKLDKVVAKQHELSEKWDKHWEALQHCECKHTWKRNTHTCEHTPQPPPQKDLYSDTYS